MNKELGIAESENAEPETHTVRSMTIAIRQLKKDCGSALVEYAVVFLLFMTMIMGTIDFGRALYTYHYLSNVTRDAARWAAVNGADCGPPPIGDNSCNGQGYMDTQPATQSDVQTFITNQTPPGIDSTKLTATVTWPISTVSPATCATIQNSPGCTVKVQLSYAFSFISPLVSRVIPATACGKYTGNLCLNSVSEMIIAH
jgi:Flp pilus assembly protein TadG